MHRHFFSSVLAVCLLVGCTVIPVQVSENERLKLSSLLQTLSASQKESTRLSLDIFQKTKTLTKEFKLTSPALWHNTLVNLGFREKGLCYHWSDALYLHLLSKKYTSFDFHLFGANIGEYWSEHNALVVIKKGGMVENGVLIDPWRDSGRLYFSKVKKDKKYSWSHRSERGCKTTLR